MTMFPVFVPVLAVIACRNCACEIDKYGKEIVPPSNVV
jgi:hypothetical protein